MKKEIISKKTRCEFREYFVGKYLREIEMEFDAADVPIDENYHPSISGQRRSLVEQYYHTVDWTKWADVRKILIVYENVLTELEELSRSPFSSKDWAASRSRILKKWIEKDGFRYEKGHLIPAGKNRALLGIAESITKIDAPELHRQIERMQDAVDHDPALAIGTAKELIETICKTILEDRGIQYSKDDDLPKLVKNTRMVLGLVPNSIPNSAKGADTIRRLLSSLGSVAQGLAELRNLYGTGHGKAGKAKGLTARHARLSVGCAATLAIFLFETHQERNI